MRAPIALTAALLALALAAPAAGAETYTVETTGDTSANPADCTMPAGTCTLRAAIIASVPGDTIMLPPGTYDNTGNDFTAGIDDRIAIVGAGARATTVREVSGGDGRVFLVEDGARLDLTGLTVTGSRNNAAVLMFGEDNALTATRVAFSGNTGAAEGGAIEGVAGAVTLTDSLVSGNTATGAGGGIHLGAAAGTLTLTNTTVTGNSAPSGSGIEVAAGQAALTSVTLAGNAGSADLAVGAAPAVARLAGTIVGGCSGSAPTSLGFNLDAGGACALGAEGDRAGDPLLGALANNGGETDTMALGAGSPALNAGGTCPATDQRGVARPQGGACDIGAFELEQAGPGPSAAAVLTGLRVRRVARRWFRVSFRLDKASKVRLAVQRCVRRRGRCVRWKRVRAFQRQGQAGRNSVRMRARGLRRGRHRLVARTEGGGAAVRRGFRVRPFRP